MLRSRFRPRLEGLEDRLVPASFTPDVAHVGQAGGLMEVKYAAHTEGLAAKGQGQIEKGNYQAAVQTFTRLIEARPDEAAGYRGRIEAEVLLGKFSDALQDIGRIRAFVEPADPDAMAAILDGYAARLAASPDDVHALKGASFVSWANFDYGTAAQHIEHLLALRPDDVYATLFRGSCRLLSGSDTAGGVADLDRAIALAPKSADVRFIVADAYTYGLHDPRRAFDEASLALKRGLDTPRIHAILAVSYQAFGDQQMAAAEIKKHIDMVTTGLEKTGPLAAGQSLSLGLTAGKTFEIPITLAAGESLSIRTDSPDLYDTILVLIGPDGKPVLGSDDFIDYFAGFDWAATQAGTYRLLVTSFEGVSTGQLDVSRL